MFGFCPKGDDETLSEVRVSQRINKPCAVSGTVFHLDTSSEVTTQDRKENDTNTKIQIGKKVQPTLSFEPALRIV